MLAIDNLKEGEVIEVEIRRHWIVYVMVAIFALVGVFITTTSFAIFGTEFLNIMCNIIFWMYFSLFLYIEWLNHELDLFIVTNNRIIGVEQVSWMNRTTREYNLGQVQEVSSKTKGVIANIFNYGTLSIQTAGANIHNLDMEFCPDAINKAREVLNIVDEYRDNEVHLKSGMTGNTQQHTHNQETEGKN